MAYNMSPTGKKKVPVYCPVCVCVCVCVYVLYVYVVVVVPKVVVFC